MTVVTITSDFTGKKAGSLIENSNIARITNYSNTGDKDTKAELLLPTEMGEIPYDFQYVYLQTADRKSALSYADDNTRSQSIFSFDVIRAIEASYGQTLWRGETDLAGKITIAKEIVKNMEFLVTVDSSRRTQEGNQNDEVFISALLNTNTWDYIGKSSYPTFTSYVDILAPITPTNYIDTDGYVHFTIYTDIDTFINDQYNVTLNVDYAKLDITLDDSLAPETPTGLTGSTEIGAITLSWTGVTGATSYNVYRSERVRKWLRTDYEYRRNHICRPHKQHG